MYDFLIDDALLVDVCSTPVICYDFLQVMVGEIDLLGALMGAVSIGNQLMHNAILVEHI